MLPPVNRRTALRLAASSLAASTFTLKAEGPGREPKWKTAVGLNGFQSGTRKYGKNYPIWEVLDFASRQGFEGVELVADWPSGGYPAADETDRIRALKRLYDLFGLRVFSIQLGADGAFDPSEAARKAWLHEFRDRARLAKAIGCDCLGVWPGGGLRGQTLDQAIDLLARTFREAGKIAGDLGLLVCFEIEPVFVFNTADHYLRILHGADHPALKGIYDPSHFDQMNGATGRPEELLQRVGVSSIGYVHFCDTDGTLRDGATSKHLACGDGKTDCAKGLSVLKQGGFRGWIMVDEWEVPDPYDACRKCKRAIDQAWQDS
ncbi:MAG TPA: sugar phosphate isomerase/epimerase family protein [Phycisphaerae bacterium]|nr:sugar phosphate isomerase/epimerase family protein [Phycisphaerae bacterium]HRY70560.1 sugar phosphate isomerase/epimerase family protein [Phycisphaerae bacterium]HSA28008.1 sugar phosphate isomerase/epimerase family protein [Phycisphaerae bacterium]